MICKISYERVYLCAVNERAYIRTYMQGIVLHAYYCIHKYGYNIMYISSIFKRSPDLINPFVNVLDSVFSFLSKYTLVGYITLY